VQAITLALVEKWGYEGFFTHTEAVAAFYREKSGTFEKALQTHLGDLAEWRTPEAGMFFWWVFLQFGHSKLHVVSMSCEFPGLHLANAWQASVS
jgi:hypothetical protein